MKNKNDLHQLLKLVLDEVNVKEVRLDSGFDLRECPDGPWHRLMWVATKDTINVVRVNDEDILRPNEKDI
jgi:hypothetical protein